MRDCFLVVIFSVLYYRLPTIECLHVAAGPPLLNSPVYSLATKRTSDDGGRTNMNLVTYASPMSIRPDRLWAIGLYKETQSYEIFKETRQGVLQLLTQDHIPIVRLLGGASGRDVDKQMECSKLGFEWKMLREDNQQYPLALSGCKSYLCLELEGESLIDGGSHGIAICRVTDMFSDSEDEAHLETRLLRELGIITAQGRIAD